MIFTALTEAFFTYLKVSFWAAICLSFPVIAVQVWKFVAPGLYQTERRAFLPYLAATPVLFIMGGVCLTLTIEEPHGLNVEPPHAGLRRALIGLSVFGSKVGQGCTRCQFIAETAYSMPDADQERLAIFCLFMLVRWWVLIAIRPR
jgi:hypothetical protein